MTVRTRRKCRVTHCRPIRNEMALNEKYRGSRINPRIRIIFRFESATRPREAILHLFCYVIWDFRGISRAVRRRQNDKIARVEHVITRPSRFTWLKNIARDYRVG